MWKYCEEIILKQLLSLKELVAFPSCLEILRIQHCPSLVFTSEKELDMPKYEVQSNYQRLLEEFVLSKSSVLKLTSKSPISSYQPKKYEEVIGKRPATVVYYQIVMDIECRMFKQIGKITKRDLSKELEILSGSQVSTLPLSEDQLQAWSNCHQERIKFIYTRVLKARQFNLPSSLTVLSLSYCNITDRALSDCLKNLCSLQKLELDGLMSLVTLPLEETMSQLRGLRSLLIDSCWLLKSLGALHKLSLENFKVCCCPCLEFENEKHCSALPASLQSLHIYWCTITSGTLCGEFPKLNDVRFVGCCGSASLSIDKLTSLTFLELFDCPNICSVSGLHLLNNLERLRLTQLPTLNIHSWPSCIKELLTDNLKVLKHFSSKTSPLRYLHLEYLEQENVMSDDLLLLDSLETLRFYHCKIKSISTDFTNLLSLQVITFEECPDISLLPEMPNSVELIKIIDCPVLKERCRHNGVEWPKIAGIKYKVID